MIALSAVLVLMMSSRFCVFAQTTTPTPAPPCDPSLGQQMNSMCPVGYCCVRDEFLPKWIYCKMAAGETESCTTKPLETNCPCRQGLMCKPNIVNADGTASLYGRCVNATMLEHVTTPCPHGHSCGHNV